MLTAKARATKARAKRDRLASTPKSLPRHAFQPPPAKSTRLSLRTPGSTDSLRSALSLDYFPDAVSSCPIPYRCGAYADCQAFFKPERRFLPRHIYGYDGRLVENDTFQPLTTMDEMNDQCVIFQYTAFRCTVVIPIIYEPNKEHINKDIICMKPIDCDPTHFFVYLERCQVDGNVAGFLHVDAAKK